MRWHWTITLGASALAACPRPAAPPPSAGEPTLRVALATGAGEVTLGAEGGALGAAEGAPAFSLAAGESLTLRVEGGTFRARGAAYTRVRLASTAPGGHVTFGGKPYRGVLDVFVAGGSITVVNAVAMEDYLRGVVNAEMGRRTAAERAAVEAQAIVSRSYALHNRGRYGAEGFDLRAGVTDQVYGGVATETPLGAAAVEATAGQVLTWDGKLIAPFYHSTCGGSTASPEEAFVSVRSTPYLRPVSDLRPGGAYCDISPRFRWTVEWEGEALRAILDRTLPAQLGVDTGALSEVRDVYIRRTGASGRPTDLRVRLAGGEVPVPGYAVRQVLAAPDGRPLGSSAVRLSATRAGDTVAHLAAEGAGWGHGVGMCQWGAVGRARAGQDARTILATYFPGARVARWY